MGGTPPKPSRFASPPPLLPLPPLLPRIQGVMSSAGTFPLTFHVPTNKPTSSTSCNSCTRANCSPSHASTPERGVIHVPTGAPSTHASAAAAAASAATATAPGPWLPGDEAAAVDGRGEEEAEGELDEDDGPFCSDPSLKSWFHSPAIGSAPADPLPFGAAAPEAGEKAPLWGVSDDAFTEPQSMSESVDMVTVTGRWCCVWILQVCAALLVAVGARWVESAAGQCKPKCCCSLCTQGRGSVCRRQGGRVDLLRP